MSMRLSFLIAVQYVTTMMYKPTDDKPTDDKPTDDKPTDDKAG